MTRVPGKSRPLGVRGDAGSGLRGPRLHLRFAQGGGAAFTAVSVGTAQPMPRRGRLVLALQADSGAPRAKPPDHHAGPTARSSPCILIHSPALWLFSDVLRQLAFSFRVLQGQRWTLHANVLLGAHATRRALGETLGRGGPGFCHDWPVLCCRGA